MYPSGAPGGRSSQSRRADPSGVAAIHGLSIRVACHAWPLYLDAMDLQRLKTFLKIAELGSLSKASDRLRIAQPALSRQVRLLEDEIGARLFTRHRRGMQLTEAGEVLMQRASGLLRQLDQMGIPRGVVLDPAAIDSASAAAHRNASYAYAELMRRGLGSQGDRVLAGLLMRAALGNIVLGLRDPSDWSLVMLDPTTGDLVRRRSFSSTRLAVIETLLLICIVALGRMVWVYKI